MLADQAVIHAEDIHHREARIPGMPDHMRMADDMVAIDEAALDQRPGIGRLAADEIQELLERIFGNRDINMPNLPAPSPILGALTPIVWGLIGAAVIAFVVFVIRKFRLGPKKKKVGDLMEEDEPERTADEWLVRYPDDASASAYIGRSGWNTLRIGGAIPDDEIEEAIDASYDAVVAKLPKRDRPA